MAKVSIHDFFMSSHCWCRNNWDIKETSCDLCVHWAEYDCSCLSYFCRIYGCQLWEMLRVSV